MVRNKSVGEVLDSCIKDPKLKRILNINISYYHHNPFKFIWSYHAIAQNNYYNKGVYIKGGSQKLSDTLSEIVRENGGEVRADSDVVEILCDDKSAKGVKYIDKKTKEEIVVYADTIIANCDPHIVYTKLLKNLTPSEYKKDSRLTEDFRLTSSLISLYMIFDKNLSELYPNMDYSTFLVDEKYFNRPFDETCADSANTPIECRDFAFVNYSKIDSGLSDRDDRYLCVGAVYSYYEEWDNPQSRVCWTLPIYLPVQFVESIIQYYYCRYICGDDSSELLGDYSRHYPLLPTWLFITSIIIQIVLLIWGVSKILCYYSSHILL